MNYHPINQPFALVDKDGNQIAKLVAVECETITYPDGYILRKTCDGCFYAYKKRVPGCGRSYIETACKLGEAFACEKAKCTPEFRDDNKFIHYKRIVKSK